ncbi:MAG: adenylate/guanylate cyclase domain-containing protein [Anaerolineaceae bacterium]
MKLNTLIVQTDLSSTRLLSSVLKSRDFEVLETTQIQEAKSHLEKSPIELLFMDLHFPGEEWQAFIRWVKQNYPLTRLILTSKYPDLQREMYAQEMGLKIFLRQPFTKQWVDNAIEKAGLSTEEMIKKQKIVPGKVSTTQLPRVIFPVQLKITLPYLILAVLFALACAYIISQVVFDSVQDRYFNQLIASSKQASDYMVREEDRLLSTLRMVANDLNVGNALIENDTGKMRDQVSPIIENAGVDSIDLLDMNGISRFSLRKTKLVDLVSYQVGREGISFSDQEFVQNVLKKVSDNLGDKFAGVMKIGETDFLCISGPVFSSNGEQAGVIVVGTSLSAIVREIQANTIANVSLYDQNGNIIVSTLFDDNNASMISDKQISQLFSTHDQSSISREIPIESVKYTELLGVWEARSGQIDLGILGISVPQAFLVQTSQVTRFQVFVLSLSAIILIVLIGVYLSNLITRPLVKLVDTSMEVANGNLDVKVESKGNDEVAVLAHSFNSMIAGLQEGSIYRDLLGRTVSPEVREQLRHTFSSGDLRLEGQDAVATVMFADIRDFTSLAEKSDPSTIFEWLNEYFGVLLPSITESTGVVNKLDGDSVLAFFGILPKILDSQTSAFCACQAALLMNQAIIALNERRRDRGDLPFITGIGIHTGEVIAGGLGTHDRIHYTIIGDTVNTTQRIEGLTRELFTDNGVLISQATLDALGDQKERFVLEPIGRHSVKGKEERIMVYRLVALAS